MACAIYEGRSLQPGTRLIGPAVIEEFATTIVIPPGSEAAMDAWGNAVITPGVTASPGERRAAG
jgi:N-methylhydantoinase A